jgi:predicted enzyme related to lactoylglutathione lyase
MSDQSLLGSFLWSELLTTDTSAAAAFYKKVVGWKTAPWSHDPTYTTLVGNAGPVGGMMILPEGAKMMGSPPNWMMYVGTPSVEDTALRIAQLRGRVLKQPGNVPGGGRFAVAQDPQGAVFGLYTPAKPQPDKGQPGVGDFSWFELYTSNVDAAWTFYSTLFGWEKTSAMDMGDMGAYQMFGRGRGVPNGGMMKSPTGAMAWMPYAMVDDARAAAKRATDLGAKIVNGPMEVPGGDWIAQGMDPQGAMFAVHSKKPAATAKKSAKSVAKKAPVKQAAAKKTSAKKTSAKKTSAKKARAAAKPRKKKAKAAKKPAKKASKK